MSNGVVESPAPSSQIARLALIVPLALERQCLDVAPSGASAIAISIVQSGQGADNAVRAARAALERGATALMSIGVAGALDAQLEAGDVIVPGVVLNAATGRRLACSRSWAQELREHIAGLCRVRDGVLLGVPEVLTSSAAKRTAGDKFAAVACDLESAAIAEVAEQAGVPFLALRVVSDISSDELPDGVAGFIDERGNARLFPVIGALMSPGNWGSIMTMNARFRLARQRLHQLSESLVSTAYCCPQP